ncbi:hypothetical protein WMY93_022640 [Mugilogobius chulae]|uniref:Uncharacterized protein n=1 Tax=Mugilogobius chulae TaxID=88201 RepID=A0AAW0N8P1_9GOBI
MLTSLDAFALLRLGGRTASVKDPRLSAVRALVANCLSPFLGDLSPLLPRQQSSSCGEVGRSGAEWMPESLGVVFIQPFCSFRLYCHDGHTPSDHFQFTRHHIELTSRRAAHVGCLNSSLRRRCGGEFENGHRLRGGFISRLSERCEDETKNGRKEELRRERVMDEQRRRGVKEQTDHFDEPCSNWVYEKHPKRSDECVLVSQQERRALHQSALLCTSAPRDHSSDKHLKMKSRGGTGWTGAAAFLGAEREGGMKKRRREMKKKRDEEKKRGMREEKREEERKRGGAERRGGERRNEEKIGKEGMRRGKETGGEG